MANHCIEVICSSCGASYCLRGCNYDLGPNPMLAMVVDEGEYISGACKHCGKATLVLEDWETRSIDTHNCKIGDTVVPARASNIPLMILLVLLSFWPAFGPFYPVFS